MTPDPCDRCMAALAEIDRYQRRPTNRPQGDEMAVPDSAFRDLADAMHALYGPLPDERIAATLRVIDGEEGG